MLALVLSVASCGGAPEHRSTAEPETPQALAPEDAQRIDAADVTVVKLDVGFVEYRDVARIMAAQAGVIAVEPFTLAEAIAVGPGGSPIGVVVKGVAAARIGRVLELDRRPGTDRVATLAQAGDAPAILIGGRLADALDARAGDQVTIILPISEPAAAGARRVFRVGGVVRLGDGERDRRLAVTDLRVLQELLGRGDEVTGVECNVEDLGRVAPVARAIAAAVGPGYRVEEFAPRRPSLFEPAPR
ncbi:MAG: hypothetical protein KA201_30790 [Kofleriaceae bacterium]|nr:hypothetical protein [Kofleriaceae bacterium]